jgi:hypothetical protein
MHAIAKLPSSPNFAVIDHNLNLIILIFDQSSFSPQHQDEGFQHFDPILCHRCRSR